MRSPTFVPDEDFRPLQEFLVEMRQRVGQAAYFQYGDLIWRMYYWENHFDATTDLQVWRGKGDTILGFVFYLATQNNPEFFIRPELYSSSIADEMLHWAIDRAKASGASTIETSCIDHDDAKASFLQRKGFERADDVLVFMARELDSTLPKHSLPSGYMFVTSVGCPELSSITGRDITQSQYATLCNAPGYRDDLGWRICYQEREIASGCVCWYDDVDNCGHLEPVGTVDRHRRKGLAHAVIMQTLERLQHSGANTVYVRTGKDNVPAVRLYQKLGFRIVDEDHGWSLAV